MTEKKQVTEGKARLVVPKTKDIHHCLVFFNSQMSFNRSLSSLAIAPAAQMLGEKLSVVDGLCATGSRGARYAVENPSDVEKVFFVEANDHAIPFVEENVEKNGLVSKSKAIMEDLNLALPKIAFSRENANFIEIDPFGSPAPFLENAVRCFGKKGVLSITATDLANLYGSRPRPCIRQYDAKPLHNFFAHETGLRILMGKIARTAAAQDYGITPLVSWYEKHYAKTIIFLEKGADKADASLKNLGYVNFCRKCFFVSATKLPQNAPCPQCASQLEYAGPLWVSECCSGEFLKKMKARIGQFGFLGEKESEKLSNFLSAIDEERAMPPWFFDYHEIGAKYKKRSGKIGDVVARLNASGKRAMRTHFSPTGIKTDATAKEVAECL